MARRESVSLAGISGHSSKALCMSTVFAPEKRTLDADQDYEAEASARSSCRRSATGLSATGACRTVPWPVMAQACVQFA